LDEQIRNGEFEYLIIAEENQIADGLAVLGRWTGYFGVRETIEFFRERGITIYGPM
jgi:hypothetical protein